MVNITQCITCKNFIDNGKWGCLAFVKIPFDILYNETMHNKKHADQDNNILYEPIDDKNKIIQE